MDRDHGLQTAHTFEHQVSLRYLLFLPQAYGQDPEKKWPLILCLHGAGERGEDLALVKVHGIAKIVEHRPDFPFVCVSPQCPEDSWWPDYTQTLKGLIDDILAQYAVDGTRLYLTGLSMGGYGTWALATRYPDLFAAIAPICGGGNPEVAPALKEVAVWAFHGEADDLVPLQASQRMVDALRVAGGDVRFTVYPGVGHDAWTQTYQDPALYDWFLQHRR
jgi:predicted peptidase